MSDSPTPTFFTEVDAMVRALGPVGIVFAIDERTDKLTLHLSPCPVDGKTDTTLCEPLFLRGDPAEFDAEFVKAMMNYRPQLESFSEQLAANNERVEQAGKAALSKATKAAIKPPPKPAAPARQGASGSTAQAGAGEPTAVQQVQQGAAATAQPSLFPEVDPA